MTDQTPVHRPRSDYLLSVCLGANRQPLAALEKLREAETGLRGMLEYYEFVLTVRESEATRLDRRDPAIASIPNLRILVVPDSCTRYRERSIAASEALGEVVVLTTPEELPVLDLATLSRTAIERQAIMIATRKKRGISLFPVYSVFRLMSRYAVRRRYLSTMALPREMLNRILRSQNHELDLRFPRKKTPFTYSELQMTTKAIPKSSSWSDRIQIGIELIRSSVPRYLRAFSYICLFFAFGAIMYALYAVLTFVLMTPQEGWFSTSIILSGVLLFVASGFSLFSIALAELLEQTDQHGRDEMLDEWSNLSLFSKSESLNVVSHSN